MEHSCADRTPRGKHLEVRSRGGVPRLLNTVTARVTVDPYGHESQ
jgi:hypothetical protein